MSQQTRQKWLNEKYEKHYDRFSRWVEFDVGISPGHGGDEKDVLQEGAIALLKRVPETINDDDSFVSWMRTCLRRRAIDLSRKKTLARCPSGSSAGPLNGQPIGAMGVGGPVSSPTTLLFRAERESYIHENAPDDETVPANAVSEDIAIVLLRVVDEVPLKEIARSLDCSAVEVAKRYHAAVAPRASLDRMEFGDSPPGKGLPRERMRYAATKLADRDRLSIELHHFERERYSLREVGEILGVKESNAGAIDSRAVERLVAIIDSLP